MAKPERKTGTTKRIHAIFQILFIVIFMIIVVLMIIEINNLQGTARVINYSGLIRGATQREIKLEIAGQPDDDLIQYLDDILYDLKYDNGNYNLISLKDTDYNQKLDAQAHYWKQLKNEIYAVRKTGYQNTDIVAMSEEYFKMADKTVNAAERYSKGIADRLRMLEIASAADIAILIIMIIVQTVTAVRIAAKNKILERKAYLDLHTGLPNKSKCEELLNDTSFITDSQACVMFDINNLKKTNDALGHSVGDQMILNFAKILRNTIPKKNFVGRYGGDEFIAVIYDTNQSIVESILSNLEKQIKQYNTQESSIQIGYANGWAISTDYHPCTLRTLLDKADKCMYHNKQHQKMARQN